MRFARQRREPISLAYRPSIILSTVSESVSEDSSRTTWTSERWSEAIGRRGQHVRTQVVPGQALVHAKGRDRRNHDIAAPSPSDDLR